MRSRVDPADGTVVDVVRTEAQRLAYTAVLSEQRRWLEQVVGRPIKQLQPGAELEYADPFGSYLASGSVALVAHYQGRPAGIVALQPMHQTSDAAELKRMYVCPFARGAGLGRRLVSDALDHARLAGWKRIVLDTQPRSMGAAIELYRSVGFRPIPPLGLARADGVASFALDLGHRMTVDG